MKKIRFESKNSNPHLNNPYNSNYSDLSSDYKRFGFRAKLKFEIEFKSNLQIFYLIEKSA